jgi:hypothetical protein
MTKRPVPQDASSATVLRSSKESLIISIGSKLTKLNEDKTLQECTVLTGLVLTISTAQIEVRQALPGCRHGVQSCRLGIDS